MIFCQDTSRASDNVPIVLGNNSNSGSIRSQIHDDHSNEIKIAGLRSRFETPNVRGDQPNLYNSDQGSLLNSVLIDEDQDMSSSSSTTILPSRSFRKQSNLICFYRTTKWTLSQNNNVTLYNPLEK